MNLIQRWILGKRLSEQLEQKAFTGIQPGIRYEVRNGRLITPADNKRTYITEGYNKNDIGRFIFYSLIPGSRAPLF